MCLITFEGNFERNFLSLLFYFHQRRRHRYCWCCYIAIVAAVVVIIFFLQWVWYLVVYFLRYSHSFIYLYVLILCMWVHLLFLLLVTPFPRVMCNIISLDLHIKYSHIYISYTSKNGQASQQTCTRVQLSKATEAYPISKHIAWIYTVSALNICKLLFLYGNHF